MKLTIVRTIFTTGASLIILSIFCIVIGENDLPVHTVFEIFGANILINFGIFFRYKFEIRYFIIEFLIDVGYIILILCIFGIIFEWFNSVPVWYLCIMAVIIYLLVIITTVVKVNQDTKEINKLLKKRKEKK